MRTIAQFLSLAALGALAFISINALYGPHRLPARIPTHFDASGHVNGWGPSVTLLFLPAIAVALYLLIALVSQFPSAFNYPVKVTEANRAQLQELSLSLLAWIKAEILVFFAWMEFLTVEAARNPERGFKPYPVFIFVTVLFATAIGHIVAMFRGAKSTQ
jgi:uncharacterized membrane protein